MSNKLQTAAERIFEELGSGTEAIEKLQSEITNNDNLLGEAISFAAHEALRAAQRYARSIITTTNVSVIGDNNQPRRYSKHFQQSVEIACGRYLNFPMMDGTKLGDADKKHLLEDANRYQKHADGNALKARFLRLVASKVREGQVVRNVMSDEQLIRLMKRATLEEPAKMGR